LPSARLAGFGSSGETASHCGLVKSIVESSAGQGSVVLSANIGSQQRDVTPSRVTAIFEIRSSKQRAQFARNDVSRKLCSSKKLVIASAAKQSHRRSRNARMHNKPTSKNNTFKESTVRHCFATR
jgi:hypothetical protein